jgi:hypothetical protein
LLAALACAGCAAAPTRPKGATVESCVQFGISAIQRRIVVRSVPPACRGLTRAEVNFAVASAVHQLAAGEPGKARQRRATARLAPYLAHLITAVPATRPRSQPAVRSAPPTSNSVLGLIALCSWLLTVGFGSYMLSKWISRRVLRRAFQATAGPDGALSPWVAFTHFGLAVTGLLMWVVYLVTSNSLVGWISCSALLPTAGFGMSLVFLGSGRRPTLVVAAHIALATATMLLTLLTVVGVAAAGG